MRSAVSFQLSAFSFQPTAFCLLPTVLWVTLTRCIGRGLASQPAGTGLGYQFNTTISLVK
jgi:hypothetical protein